LVGILDMKDRWKRGTITWTYSDEDDAKPVW